MAFKVKIDIKIHTLMRKNHISGTINLVRSYFLLWHTYPIFPKPLSTMFDQKIKISQTKKRQNNDLIKTEVKIIETIVNAWNFSIFPLFSTRYSVSLSMSMLLLFSGILFLQKVSALYPIVYRLLLCFIPTWLAYTMLKIFLLLV